MRDARSLLLAAAILAILAFAGQWRPLFDPDEGRYVAGAVQMLDSGDWFTPHLRDDYPHLSKPPLAYWAIASSIRVFGHSELASRVPWTLAYLGTILVVALLARSLVPGRERLAAFIFGTMLLPWAASRILTPDALLALFESAAMLGFVLWRYGHDNDVAPSGPPGSPRIVTEHATREMPRLPTPPPARHDDPPMPPRGAGIWIFWIALGLAALTKGPPGLIPLLPVLVLLAIRDRRALLRLASPLPLLAFLVIATGWYVAQAIARPDVVDYWIGSEIAGRIVSGEHVRHGGPLGAITVYVPTILLGTLPWILLLRRKRTDEPRLQGEARLFVLLWLLVPLGVFAVARSRLPLYLLPLATPAAVWLAARIDPERLRRPLAAVAGVTWIGALIVLSLLAGQARRDRNGEALARAITASVGQVPDELVFINENPSWSLRFYLGRPLQRVNLYGYEDWGDEGYRPLSKRLFCLVGEPPKSRLYLLPEKHHIAFRNEMREHGREIARAGEFDRLVFFGEIEN